MIIITNIFMEKLDNLRVSIKCRLKEPRLIKRDFKFLYQKLVRGWSDEETWNLDRSFAFLILPRLKRFKELSDGFPAHLTEEEWNKTLSTIIEAFEMIASKDYYENKSKVDIEKIQNGLDLFAKYYFNLWW